MSLEGAYDPSNIFSKIIQGKMPCAKVYEDEDVLSFMDAFPQSRGHTLVIPKLRVRNLLDVDSEMLQILIERTQMIAKGVQKAFLPEGIILTQFNGAVAGQTVFHLHFHIIPRYADSGLSGHAGTKMADMEQLERHAAIINAALDL